MIGKRKELMIGRSKGLIKESYRNDGRQPKGLIMRPIELIGRRSIELMTGKHIGYNCSIS